MTEEPQRDRRPLTGEEFSLEELLAPINHSLTTGGFMTGANLAMELLCERLGVNRDRLVFDRLWAQK